MVRSTPSTSGSSRRAVMLLLLVCALAAGVGRSATAAAPPPSAKFPPGTAAANSAKELLAAMSDPAVSTIQVTKPFAMPHGTAFKPAVVNRQLLITSPFRAMIDWCDARCQQGQMSKTPFIILGKGAIVTFNRLFFRNLVPHNSSSGSSSSSRSRTAAPAALDFDNSPVPWVVSRDGGQATYNLVVMHWTPPMFWVFKQNGTFWEQAAAQEIKTVSIPKPLQLQTPELYVIKSFSTDGTASMMDCYMPVDVDSCLSNQPFDTTLIYCPYTFKDSLKNPWVDNVVVFHNIGLDRLVNSYRNPAVVDRSVVYTSCPGTRHLMDLDNITNTVLVSAGGSLTFQRMIMQGSKSQNKTDWPSSIPLLLSTFRPTESGTVILRDSTVRVTQMDSLIQALNKLPSGGSGAVEIPDLQPTYVGSRPPKLGDTSFGIRNWQLQRNRWMLTRAGGSTIMDKISSAQSASWQFFNVSVETYTEPDCFAAAVVQGSTAPGTYSVVSSGQELLDQLANTSARYIEVTNDLNIPPNLGLRRITVSRIVEVRSCANGAAHVVDWAGNQDSVVVTGNAIWEGNMVFKGIGWSDATLNPKGGQLVEPLHPAGTGIIEFEDLVLQSEMPEPSWHVESGKPVVAALLNVTDLDGQPFNMSLMGPSKLLMRGFYLNRSEVTSGTDGVESFLDVTLSWSPARSASSSSGLSQGALLAAIIVPVIFFSILLGTILACMFCKRLNTLQQEDLDAAGKDVDGTNRRGSSSTSALAWLGLGRRSGGGPGASMGKAGPHVVVSVKDGAASSITGTDSPGSASPLAALEEQQASVNRTMSGSGSKSKTKSAFDADIAQACKTLVAKRNVGRDDELYLESVLGEGSYGKVFKGTWRGTVVAVKIMVLPSHMSGKEKREKMAVMETAISSSLSHPNCVQTYTYALEPVRANSNIKDVEAEGPGAGMSLHDSTHSGRAGLSRHGKDQDGSNGSDTSAFSWEVRLVQEYCDLGSLRAAFKQGHFRSPNGAVLLPAVADTALDVARAMAHLHKHNIVHSDLKARNILLRSDNQDPRGFVAKVADFGLSLTIDPNSTHISNAFQGTMTHMAPETLMHGRISPASDVFAFGILLFELYTGENAYKGVPRALLGHNVTKQGMRPVFPPDTPFEWQFLACRCWESDPAIRPTFDQILSELKRVKERWSFARNSSERSAAASSAAGYSSSTLYDTTAQPPRSGLSQQQQQQHNLSQQQQQQPAKRLPSIEDNSGPLPCSDQQQQQQQQGGLGADVGQQQPQQPPVQQQQQQQQHWRRIEDVSKDALVLLSDCGGTFDSTARA